VADHEGAVALPAGDGTGSDRATASRRGLGLHDGQDDADAAGSQKAVSERKNKNVSVYEALVSPQDARGSAWSTFLNQAFDGATEPLLHFLVRERHLTKRQRRQLAQLLEEEERKEKEGQ